MTKFGMTQKHITKIAIVKESSYKLKTEKLFHPCRIKNFNGEKIVKV